MKPTNYYNLDVIISVGYRVKSRPTYLKGRYHYRQGGPLHVTIHNHYHGNIDTLNIGNE